MTLNVRRISWVLVSEVGKMKPCQLLGWLVVGEKAQQMFNCQNHHIAAQKQW